MLNFLGNVNLFHGRTEGGTVHLEAVGPGGASAPAGPTTSVSYARPHLLDIDHDEPVGRPHLRAEIAHINAAGAVVKVELVAASGAAVNVELSHERYRQLGLQKGQEVFVGVKNMTVFTPTQRMKGAGI